MNSAQFNELEQDIGLIFAGQNLGEVLSRFLLYFFPFAGLTMLLYLLYGGYQYMLSKGDPKAAEAAKSKITHAIMGFGIIFVSYWIVQAVGVILGITAITSTF